ncbi:GNAT family N-acetyltransferase [Alienimonas californiensis]|uniref:Amino-acid acetyltransferase n=1 Tax=Alienimonas californiensis TaxID=2527989 RepID=A0A517PFC9_9PLAN|nr:GNAT family N-acetyltransferase [Alienimonas californiensis]QDT18087.1 Amino-acid acetyltransferase [Alienimonas californiensis]
MAVSPPSADAAPAVGSVAAPSSPTLVRPAVQSDVPAVHAFIRPFVATGRLLERTMDELEELVPTGFVAVDPDAAAAGDGAPEPADGRVVGFAALEIYSPKLAEVRSLAVSDAYRGKGVGRALVARCVALARQRNVLEVMAVTSSESFFTGCGFDFTLPGEKKALFLQTRDVPARPVEG